MTKRNLVVYLILLGLAVAVGGWQYGEHQRVKLRTEEGLVKSGRDITSTVGVVVRSLRRFGLTISRDRLQSALQELIGDGKDIESITVLGTTGEAIVSVGKAINLSKEELLAGGVLRREDSWIIMNPMDLGAKSGEDSAGQPAAIVVEDDRMTRGFRGGPSTRRQGDEQGQGQEGQQPQPPQGQPPPDGQPQPQAQPPQGQAQGQAPGQAAQRQPQEGQQQLPPPQQGQAQSPSQQGQPPQQPQQGQPPEGQPQAGLAQGQGMPPPEGGGGPTGPDARERRGDPAGRPGFGRPFWMTEAEFAALIQKQGARSMAIALPTEEIRRVIRNDLMLRSLVSLLAAAAAVLGALSWRNLSKTSELQLRLVKAGEMNAHLKEMNLAAAGLAHETRNPLNLIRGLGQMIAMETGDVAELKQHAVTIIEEADRVTVQLNEFINYSKPREAHLAPVAITRVAADVARTLKPDTEEKQIQIGLPESQLLIEADEPLLRQALFNLLLNAVQSVELGGRIDIVLTPVSAHEATLEVRDDGPGVPRGQREAIFKPYVTMRPKGVGLGLAIVHQIVAAHGWSVSCGENQPRGATFRISHLKIAVTSA